ncbi:bifunctional 4-hydroxy-2-oxoglutarate aldolase/2-dehydro-3-deoxy-phosphogluconate aldolase [Microbacterium sp. A196]|uniref:bifunctional 4-hydroxy-2-oxoglutarate aldolase/2-dehydro-3-deoxy-phosphogluconate aldolase n=1 Tax=Microbacterium sp. A196 TaxID=3457320 RepID=UPI003FD0A432
MTHVREVLHQAKIMGIVRETDASVGLALAGAALEAGLAAIEVSFTTPDAAGIMSVLRRQYPQASIGAGTITTPAAARTAAEAGAQFMVSQGLDGSTLRAAREAGVPFFPGVLTPTELIAALSEGATAVKIFPLAAMGPSYLRDLRGPFPDVEMIAVGGMDLSRSKRALQDGACCVGIGSPLFGAPSALRRGGAEHLALVQAAVQEYLALDLS